MSGQTINSFIKKLQAVSEDKRKLPLVINCINGLQVSPEIKMQFKDNDMFSGKVEKMVITP